MIAVLMSVYARESPRSLALALESLCAQTVAPDQVVLVKDGPLTVDLDAVVDGFAARLPLTIVALPTNVGLARALNAGLRATTQPWILRFDTDDLCVPQRIEWQREAILAGTWDLFGGQIDEFADDPAQAHQSRRVPTTHEEILRFARRRNPFNHMTVCYRRERVEAVGGYPDIPLMEDFALWLRLLAAGARTCNLPRVLVHARVGNGMLQRRGGWRYVRSEWRLQQLMHELGFKSRLASLRDGTLRSLVFLAPVGLRGWIYRRALRAAPSSGRD